MKYITFILFSITILLSSCAKPDEAPEFKGIRNVVVTKVEGSKAYITADALFYNPNNINMKLKKVDIALSVEGSPVGVVDHKLKTKIPALDDFKVPLEVAFDLKEIGVLNSLMGLLGAKKMEVGYKGYLRVAAHGITIRVPVDDVSEVRLR